MFSWFRSKSRDKEQLSVAQSAEEVCQYKPWVLVSQNEIFSQPNYAKISKRIEKTQSEWIHSHLGSTVAKNTRLYTPEQILELCMEIGTFDALLESDQKSIKVKQLMALLVSAIYYRFKVPAWVSHFFKHDIFLEEYAKHLQLATPMRAFAFVQQAYSKLDKIDRIPDEDYDKASSLIDMYHRDILKIVSYAASKTDACLTVRGMIYEWYALKRIGGQSYLKIDEGAFRAAITYFCALTSLYCSRDCLTPDDYYIVVLMRKLGEIHAEEEVKPSFSPQVIVNHSGFPPTEPRRNHLRVVTTTPSE